MEIELNSIQFIRSYWNYFLDLESQLIMTKRFVDFDRNNNNTFSVEYLKLLQATCSEIDVVAKIFADKYDANFKKVKNKNIQKWGYVIQSVFSDIEHISVCFNNDYEIIPWKNWRYEQYLDKSNHMRYRLKSGKETPAWWTAYNKVKHERTSNYNNGQMNYVRANLGNLILAMAALYVLEELFLIELNRDGIAQYEKSKLFTFVNNQTIS